MIARRGSSGGSSGASSGGSGEGSDGPPLGAEAEVTLRVRQQDTARALGSGDVDVLATPRVLALAEQAARTAVAGALPPEQTTVGTWAEIHHRLPSRVGVEVRATAQLTDVTGMRLTFAVDVVDDGGELVATVAHRRAVVARADF